LDIRTPEQLNAALSREFAWRIRELDQLRDWVRRTAGNRTAQDGAIRSGVAMLYAHWEGFVKATGTAYVNYVAMQRLTYTELAVNFVAMAMKRQLNEASSTTRASLHNDIASFFLHGMTAPCNLPWRTAVATKSNLSSSVLREIVSGLGLEYGYYATKEKLIDHGLLEARNEIAHGEYLTIGQGVFLDLFDQVVTMMRVFQNQIDNAASQKAYRR
jgi:hypothetical protein